jgi:DNA-binding NtrC family response regulator
VRGTETVLVVEDSNPLRTLIGSILKERGFTVIAAGGGEEAIRAADGHAGPIHLLVTDVVMRDIGGRELAHRLSGRLPGLRVLYISGTEDPTGASDLPPQPGTKFLAKPFTPDDLILKVRELLDSPL